MKARLAAGLCLVLVCAFGGAWVLSQPAPGAVTITLERPVHFVSPDGADVVLAPGAYTVRARDLNSIQVAATVGGQTNVVQAQGGTHAETLSASRAVAAASSDDVVHIVLLMPGGTTLDAAGTLSGVRTRGGIMAPMPPQQLADVIATQTRLGTTRTPIPGVTPLPGGAVTPLPGAGGTPIAGPGGTPVPGPGGVVIPQQGTIGQVPSQFGVEQRLPTPVQKPAGSLFSGRCAGPDGKPMPIDRMFRVNLAAKATAPFSVELTWTGPAMSYEISDGVSTFVAGAARLQGGVVTPNIGTAPAQAGRAPSGAAVAGTASSPTGQVYRYDRPGHAVLPDFNHNFLIRATLPDGRLVCESASTKTPPQPIAPLQSVFVNPGDVRLGFVRPPYAAEVVVYRRSYVEDGRRAPFDKELLREPQPPQSNIRQVNPGLPPLPTDYNQPIVYPFRVEAIWRNGPQSSSAQLDIPVQGPLPLRGWADLHTHPMSHLAFGGKLFHGAPDVGSLLPSLSIPRFKDIDPRFLCDVVPGRRTATIDEALADDSSTHGDPYQSVCGDVIRKALIVGLEVGNHANMPQPGRRRGAPVFDAWPVWNDVTHQKMWVDWIRRAYDGGLRVMVALSHNNRLLAMLARGDCSDPKNCWIPPDDRASSDLQVEEIKRFVLRHSDFMEVALSSADLYRIVRGDPSKNIPPKLAVILGIEVDNIGNFCPGAPRADRPFFRDYMCRSAPPTQKQVLDELTRLYNTGVRYVFPVHVTDNAFAGTAPYNVIFSAANLMEIGTFWDVECAGTAPFPDDGIGFRAPNITDIDKDTGLPLTSLLPKQLPVPTTPACAPGAGHRNTKSLNATRDATAPAGFTNIGIGEFAVKTMMRLGMIVDIDHMSHRTAEAVLRIAEDVEGGGYPLMSGHSAVRGHLPPNSPLGTVSHFNKESLRAPAQLDRIGCLGGMFGLGTDEAEPRDWAGHYQAALGIIRGISQRCPHKQIGRGAVAFGTDTNSLVKAPKPLLEGKDQPDRLLNVYTARVGNATRFPLAPASKPGPASPPWDLRTHGVVHFGMFADFVKAVWSFERDPAKQMFMSGQDLVENHLERNADNFWRMWVKVEAQKNQVRY